VLPLLSSARIGEPEARRAFTLRRRGGEPEATIPSTLRLRGGEPEATRPPTSRGGEPEATRPPTSRGGETNDALPPDVTINVPSNFLIVHSTMPYQLSKRSTKEGTWFLSELRLAFDSPHTPDTDVNFLELLARTNAGVTRRESVAYLDPKKERIRDDAISGHKCTTMLSHRLCTDLVFRKSTAQQDEDMTALEL